MSVLLQVLKSALIETSSDFIIAAHETLKITKNKNFSFFDSVYQWELKNYGRAWEENVQFIESKMYNLDMSDYLEIQEAYTSITQFFLSNEACSRRFPMDTIDKTGWQIFKELEMKRELARKYCAIKIMKDQHAAQN